MLAQKVFFISMLCFTGAGVVSGCVSKDLRPREIATAYVGQPPTPRFSNGLSASSIEMLKETSKRCALSGVCIDDVLLPDGYTNVSQYVSENSDSGVSFGKATMNTRVYAIYEDMNGREYLGMGWQVLLGKTEARCIGWDDACIIPADYLVPDNMLPREHLVTMRWQEINNQYLCVDLNYSLPAIQKVWSEAAKICEGKTSQEPKCKAALWDINQNLKRLQPYITHNCYF